MVRLVEVIGYNTQMADCDGEPEVVCVKHS